MKHLVKILLGLAAIWPLVYVGWFLALALNSFGQSGTVFRGSFSDMFTFHVITIVISSVLTIFFMTHVVRNDGLEPVAKVIWLLLIFFMGIVAQPIYWYLNIWNEPGPPRYRY